MFPILPYLDAAGRSIYCYRKEMKMIYEHDPESPFSKILVKNGSSVVGIIRRSFITGHYHFYDNLHDALDYNWPRFSDHALRWI